MNVFSAVEQVANCGDRAIEQIKAQPERFDIVLTDIRMPGEATGWALAEHARSVMPNVPVVYLSGDSGIETSESFLTASCFRSPFR